MTESIDLLRRYPTWDYSQANIEYLVALRLLPRPSRGIDSCDLFSEALLRGDELVAPVYGIDLATPSIIR